MDDHHKLPFVTSVHYMVMMTKAIPRSGKPQTNYGQEAKPATIYRMQRAMLYLYSCPKIKLMLLCMQGIIAHLAAIYLDGGRGAREP